MMASRRFTVMCATLVLVTSLHWGCGGSSGTSGSGASAPHTTLRITNTTSSSLTVSFVSAAVGEACPSADKLLTAEELYEKQWCTGFTEGLSDSGKCEITLHPAGHENDSVTVPNPHGKCISGSFAVGGFAACGTQAYPDGWTQGEFTLNPTAEGAQESVDISGVNGINYAISISLESGWYYGDNQSITTVGPNGPLNSNIGKPGVYPNGCTDCIRLVGPPVCTDLTSNPTCQESRICNVKRDNIVGDTVEFRIGELL